MSRKELEAVGGQVMISQNGTVQQLLRSAYPEYKWDEERFIEEGRFPRGYRRSKENLMRKLEKIEEKMGIQQVSNFGS